MAQYSDSLFPDANIAVQASPTSQLPDNSIRLAVDARSQAIQQTTSSSLTRSFKGNYLTTVAHNAAITDAHFHYAGDEDIDSAGESEVSSADSADDDHPHDAQSTLLAMDIDDQRDPTELRSHALTWGIHIDPTFNLTVCLDCGVAVPWKQAYGSRTRYMRIQPYLDSTPIRERISYINIKCKSRTKYAQNVHWKCLRVFGCHNIPVGERENIHLCIHF